MSRPSLFGRGVLRRSSLSLLAVATLLAGALMIEHVVKSRQAAIGLSSEIPTASEKLHLGLNAAAWSLQALPTESERGLPLVGQLPYRQQCLLGLIGLGSLGLFASMRPFDPERLGPEQPTSALREHQAASPQSPYMLLENPEQTLLVPLKREESPIKDV